jgi:hypothetical protein
VIGESLAFHQAAHEGRLTFLDLGAGNASIAIYGNTRPGVDGGAAGADPLFTFALTKPCGAIVGSELVLESAGLALVANSGSPAWARVLNGNGDFAFDCDAGGPDAVDVEVVCSAAIVFAGGEVNLTSAAFG